jgi:hypothetical protein
MKNVMVSASMGDGQWRPGAPWVSSTRLLLPVTYGRRNTTNKNIWIWERRKEKINEILEIGSP